jgi:hypothetical protein
MKKKKNMPEERTDSGEIFPVDTLGIPILVDVVESAADSDADEGSGIPADKHEPKSKQPDPYSDADQLCTTELPAEVHLDQITHKIAKAVTGEIMAALEPLVRDKVDLALRMYEDELLKLSDEESVKKAESD